MGRGNEWRSSAHPSEKHLSTKSDKNIKKEGKTIVNDRGNKGCEEAKESSNKNITVEVEEWFERYDDEGGYMYYYNAKTGGSLPYI